MEVAEATSDAPASDGKIVLRNTMYLGIAEVLSMPLSMLLNAMMGRYLGPADLGDIYLATTAGGLAFLIITWGHNGSLPAAVVADRPDSGRWLGTSLVWRASAAAVAYLLMAGAAHLFGFTERQQ